MMLCIRTCTVRLSQDMIAQDDLQNDDVGIPLTVSRIQSCERVWVLSLIKSNHRQESYIVVHNYPGDQYTVFSSHHHGHVRRASWRPMLIVVVLASKR